MRYEGYYDWGKYFRWYLDWGGIYYDLKREERYYRERSNFVGCDG